MRNGRLLSGTFRAMAGLGTRQYGVMKPHAGKSPGFSVDTQSKMGHISKGQLITDSSWKKWRVGFVVVGLPCLILGHVNAFGLVDPEEHKRPEFVAYEYMRTRTKVC